jgi:hypothetical protein
MTDRWWSTDERLLVSLDTALRAAREVPRSFVDVGKASYAWHNIDAELAALSYDSATDELAERLSVTRAESAPLRAMTFAAEQLTIEVEVISDALIGQLVPPPPGEAELILAKGEPTTLTVDEVGVFTVRPVPIHAFRLRCRTGDGANVMTNWIVL